MTAYYIDALNGSDINPGTDTSPFATIQKAADIAIPGDACLVYPGNYERTFIDWRNQGGAPGSPIIYESLGGAICKGFGIQRSDLEIRGFEITDIDRRGIYLEGDRVVVEDNFIHYCVGPGIQMWHPAGNPIADCVLRNNRLWKNALAGAEVAGQNHLIEKNEVWETIQHHPDWPEPHPVWLDADGFRFFGSGHIFRSNYIHDISFEQSENIDAHIDAFQTWDNAQAGSASDCLFEKNIIDLLTPPVDGHAALWGWMLAGALRMTIRNNIVRAYGGVNTGGDGCSELVAANNLFENDVDFGFYPNAFGLHNCPQSKVLNNILYNHAYHTIVLTGDITGTVVDYNFAFREDGQPSPLFTIEFQPTPQPPNHLWDVDPMFVDAANLNYQLLPESPAIDSEIGLTEVQDDFLGVARPQGLAPDMGAFEYKEDLMSVITDLQAIEADLRQKAVELIVDADQIAQVIVDLRAADDVLDAAADVIEAD